MSVASRLRILGLVAAACCFAGTATLASAAPHRGAGGIHILNTKNLTDIPGKQAVMLTLEVPPGGSSPAHRHDAHVWVYVLDGTFITQVKGKPKETLHKGQWFYEGPNDIHEVSANGSSTRPLKLLIFMIKNQGKPLTMPAK
ncbi:MAG: cupin domain-containing protein [Steroidobacteraceae bacterium]